jgi:hypothetical protein
MVSFVAGSEAGERERTHIWTRGAWRNVAAAQIERKLKHRGHVQKTTMLHCPLISVLTVCDAPQSQLHPQWQSWLHPQPQLLVVGESITRKPGLLFNRDPDAIALGIRRSHPEIVRANQKGAPTPDGYTSSRHSKMAFRSKVGLVLRKQVAFETTLVADKYCYGCRRISTCPLLLQPPQDH